MAGEIQCVLTLNLAFVHGWSLRISKRVRNEGTGVDACVPVFLEDTSGLGGG